MPNHRTEVTATTDFNLSVQDSTTDSIEIDYPIQQIYRPKRSCQPLVWMKDYGAS